MIDHPILYSDNIGSAEWNRLVTKANGRDGFWRRYARRKMRRVVKQLLEDIKPNIYLGNSLEFGV